MTESPRKRRTAPKVLGALAAAGALGLTVPSAIASACPEHDNGSDSASNAGAAGASNSSPAKSNAEATGTNSSANANSTRTRSGSKTSNAGNGISKPGNEPAQTDSIADCSAGSSQLRTGACGPDPV